MNLAPEQRYGSDSVWRDPKCFFAEFLRDLGNSRELAWQLFLRNLKSRYRQSIMGYIWAFVPPLAWTGLFAILRLQDPSRTDGQTGYMAHVMVGLVFWQVFIEAVQTPMRTFSEARSMLAKLKFPRESLVAAGLLDVGLQFLIRLPLLIAGWLLFPEASASTWWLLPGLLLGLLAVGTCIGIVLLPLSLLYQDVAPAAALAGGFWLLLTPVAHVPASAGLMSAINQWNPAAVLIETTRAGWLGTPMPHIGAFVVVALAGGVIGVIAWMAARIAFPHLIARFGS